MNSAGMQINQHPTIHLTLVKQHQFKQKLNNYILYTKNIYIHIHFKYTRIYICIVKPLKCVQTYGAVAQIAKENI